MAALFQEILHTRVKSHLVHLVIEKGGTRKKSKERKAITAARIAA